jgi:ubiquinone/menaquinone biosynthesis C-methylase UbiE
LAGKADGVVATDLSPGMLALARGAVTAANVTTFQVEDCQRTSFPEAAFDTAFMSLVMHFTGPDLTLAEMRRILKRGGSLIIANLDPRALAGLDRVRCAIRIVYRGLTGDRLKPPKGFGSHVMRAGELGDRLRKSGFEVVGVETIKDPSIPVEYVRAVNR